MRENKIRGEKKMRDELFIAIPVTILLVCIIFLMIHGVNESNTAMERCLINYPDTIECINSGFLSSKYECIASNGTILGQVGVR